MTTYQNFGNDVPISQLPADFAAAVNASIACQAAQQGGKTPCDLVAYQAKGYDTTVGSAQEGYGYCANPTYRQMTYCSCVNAPVANSECIFQACTNGDHSYKNVLQLALLSNGSKNCPQSVNCQQVFEMGGSDNVASQVAQTQSCGGVVNNMVTNIQAHPFLAIVVLILVLSVVMLVSGSGRGASKGPSKTLPPPELVMPSTL